MQAFAEALGSDCLSSCKLLHLDFNIGVHSTRAGPGHCSRTPWVASIRSLGTCSAGSGTLPWPPMSAMHPWGLP
eukprot:12419539-Karenia_brevis.AAC.1